MRRWIFVFTVVIVTFAITNIVFAQETPGFRLGFKALAEQIPDVVGQPLENEHWGDNGDSLQQTTTGLMVWRKADNWTAFTNGSRTWINGPAGVQDRGNDERFPWEVGDAVGQPIVSGAPSGQSSPTSEASASGKVVPSVVLIATSDVIGSGFVVADGWLLTNAHVVSKAASVAVQTNDGRRLDGVVTARSSKLDMALVRVPGLNLPGLPLADISKMRQGDPVLAVGYPLGLGGGATVTRGVYSAVRVIGDPLGEWVQTDAAINSGNSGGPLVNLNGEVVGMVTWGISNIPGTGTVEGIKFALSSNSLQDNLPALFIASREAPPGSSPADPSIARDVEEFLKRYDAAEIVAYSSPDPTPLRDLQSPVLQAQTVSTIEAMKQQGVRLVHKLVGFQFKAAYTLPGDLVAAEVVERWSGQVYKGDTLVEDDGESEQPQVAIVKRVPGGWQLRATQWLEIRPVSVVSAAPFSDWKPGPGAAGFPVSGVIDVPKSGDTARGILRIAGWALDPRAEGQPWNGIDDFRVLVDGIGADAQRIDSPDKVSRGERPDVATALGNGAFSKSGFAIDVVPPVGRHVIHVFVHSTASGWWYKSIPVDIQAPPPPPSTSFKGESWFSYHNDGSTIYQGVLTNQDSRFSVTDLEVVVRVVGSGGKILSEGKASVSNRTVRPGEQVIWQYYLPPSISRQTVYCEYRYTWNWLYR